MTCFTANMIFTKLMFVYNKIDKEHSNCNARPDIIKRPLATLYNPGAGM